MELKNRIFWALISTVIERGSYIIVSILLARNLNLNDFSKYSMFILTVNAFTAVFAIGLSSHISKNITNRSETSKIIDIYSLNVILSCIASLIALVYCFVLQLHIYETLAYAISIFFLVKNVFTSGAITSLNLFKKHAVVVIISCLILTSFMLISILNKDVNLAFLGFVLSIIIIYFGDLYFVKKNLLDKMLFDLEYKINNILVYKKILFDIYPLAVVAILNGTIMWIVGLYLKNNSTLLNFNLFALSLQLYSTFIFFPAILSKALFSWSSNQNSYTIHKKIVIKILFIGMLALLFIFLNSQIFDLLYGKEYRGNSMFFIACIISAVLFSPMNYLNNILILNDKYQVIMSSYLVWFSLVLLISLVLININFLFTYFWLAFMIPNFLLLFLTTQNVKRIMR